MLAVLEAGEKPVQLGEGSALGGLELFHGGDPASELAAVWPTAREKGPVPDEAGRRVWK